MSLFALPVTVDDILDLQDCIQFFTNEAQATSQAAAINAGTTTVYDYALQLLAANLATSQVAVAVPSIMLNETPTVGVIENVTLNFLPDQIDFAISRGLDPVVYAAETWAVNAANDSAADFAALYGGLNSTQFAAVVSAATGVNTTAILGFINNWVDFYTENPGALPTNLDVQLASYAAAFGDAIGNALVDDSVFTEGVNAFAENALLTICTGQYVAGVAPGAIPQHTPLQGEQNLRLTIGVDNLSTTAPDQVFDATPAANPPFGSDNTLNTGDTLTDTAGDGVINFTTAGGLGQFVSNPPFALGVTMEGIQTANILHAFPLLVPAGFSGLIEGLTNVNLVAGNIGDVQLGLPTLGLLSAVENITIDSVGPIISLLPDLELWMDDSAFDGTQVVDLTLNGVGELGGFATEVDLEVVGGAVGYGQVNVFSNTGPNVLFLDSDSMDSIATVVAAGTEDLVIGGSVLTQGLLELFDGSAMTGNIVAGFSAGVGGLEAIGGEGDDDFWYFAFFDDPTTFTADDSVDGGAGDNRLFLEAYNGALLGAGVGPNIVNIDRVVHTTFQPFADDPFFVPMTGDLTVDASRLGSANELELGALYGDFGFFGPPSPLFNVDVTNLTNAREVIYSGQFVDDLTLEHTSAVGTIHFTMAANPDLLVDSTIPFPGSPLGDVQFIRDLIVDTDGFLDFVSTGAADTNLVEDAGAVDANVSLTGDVDLVFGFDDPYDHFGGIFGNGVFDASGFEADLQIGLGFFNQTAIGGIGDDFFDVQSSVFGLSVDTIDLSVGGSDTVQFDEVFLFAGGSLLIGSFEYHTVVGFDQADDVININVDAIPIVDTGIIFTDDITPGTDLNTFFYNGGIGIEFANVAEFNFIKFLQPQNTGILSVQGAFDLAMNLGFSAIAVTDTGAAFERLASFYDATNGQMVLFTVDSGGDGFITAFDDVDVVALVEMTQAEYDAFDGTNLAFTAAWDPFA